MNDNKWRLPHGVDELLPPKAGALERLRRSVLDLFKTWGYEHIEPPLIEYLDSLLVGSGQDLDLQTLKVIDQQSGRMLGVRADMTSQAVRIDSHSRRSEGIQRFCYAGPVVHANPRGALDARIQFKAGAELFGSPAPTADAEVVALMLAALAVAGVEKPVLLLGHMGVFRALVEPLQLPSASARQLFEARAIPLEQREFRVVPSTPLTSPEYRAELIDGWCTGRQQTFHRIFRRGLQPPAAHHGDRIDHGFRDGIGHQDRRLNFEHIEATKEFPDISQQLAAGCQRRNISRRAPGGQRVHGINISEPG